jgi:hypothetical protein
MTYKEAKRQQDTIKLIDEQVDLKSELGALHTELYFIELKRDKVS